MKGSPGSLRANTPSITYGGSCIRAARTRSMRGVTKASPAWRAEDEASVRLHSLDVHHQAQL